MNLTVFEYVVAIAEERKLAKAAERLFVTPSALSQSLKKLESSLGFSIFERVNGHVLKLTDSGEIYVAAARKILKIADDVSLELADMQSSNRSSFVFGCSPNRGIAMMTNVFPTFHKAYPNVRITLMEAYLNAQYDMVLNGTVDIAAITPVSDELSSVDMEFLDEEEIVLTIPGTHRLAYLADSADGSGTITLDELKLFRDDKWMLTFKNAMLRNLTDSIFDRAGFFPQNVLLETSSTNPHISAVEEGIAVSLMPIPRGERIPNMRILHLEPRQFRRLYAIYRKGYLLSESQQFFLHLIRSLYQNTPTDLPLYKKGW